MEQLETNNSEFIKPQKPFYKRPKFYFWLVLALVLFFVLRILSAYNTIVIDNSGSSGGLWQNITGIFKKDESQKKDDLNPMPQPEEDRFDVLIMGIRGTDEKSIEQEGGLLADTIVIASLDKKSQKAALVSIPRDLYVEMEAPSNNGKLIEIKGKINQVYERGLANGGGIGFSERVISKITGIYIDKTVVFDFNAFQKIVENLGGVDVNLAKPFVEKSQWGYEFNLPAGKNHLNGEQALYYARSRYSTSDFDRSRRQQELIIAIKNKMLGQGLISNPLKLDSLLSALKGNIWTDFQIWDISQGMALAKSLDSKTPIKQFVISTDNLVYETKTEKGEYILLSKEANFQGIKNTLAGVLSDAPKVSPIPRP
jgi:LCP family protein required for cell wall assembly